MAKKFGLSPGEIRPLAMGFGACMASDRITVDRQRVGFMYREDGDHDSDSGWRFLAGDESEEYLSNPSNFEIYDVNTIANYDPAIVRHLEAPIGASFVRDPSSGQLLADN